MASDRRQTGNRERAARHGRPLKLGLLRTGALRWKLLIGFAFVSGLIPVVMAFTVHDRCSSSDPSCVFHKYTLVQAPGPWVLTIIAGPAVISVIVAIALHLKLKRRSVRAENVAWGFAILSCVLGLVGLVISGLVMLVPAVFTVWAVAVTPFPPDPADPLAAPGAGYFSSRQLDQQ